MDTTQLGYINACIAGDRRYSSRIEVLVEGDKVHVVLSENGAVGGMDGPGGSHGFSDRRRTTVARDAKSIVKAIKEVMDTTIQRYGKPTKNFVWAGTNRRGLSVAACQEALEVAVDD